MSGKGRGSGGGGARASSSSYTSLSVIPSSTKKTIQHIKDVTENHSEDEIYAMLKECSMDPNETVTKLLLLDTFHEVKRKRDKRKDNVNNDATDSRSKSGTQGRGIHGGRSNYLPRYASHESGVRNSNFARDSGNQSAEKVNFDEKKDAIAVSAACPTVAIVNGPAVSVCENAGTKMNSPVDSGAIIDDAKLGREVPQPHVDCDMPTDTDSHHAPDESHSISRNLPTTTSPPSSVVCFSTSDPVLLPSIDTRVPGVVGTVKREVGSNRCTNESFTIPDEEKSGKVPKTQVAAKGSELSQSRSSSTYNTRSQQLIGQQKVGGNKEWKPKSTSQNSVKSSLSESHNNPAEVNGVRHPPLETLSLEEGISTLQKKTNETDLPPRQHVIIPNHIHVPDSERTKLSFGSFDVSFGLISSYGTARESEESLTSPSESIRVEETAEELAFSKENSAPASTMDNVVYSDSTQPSVEVSGKFSGDQTVAYEATDSQSSDVSRLRGVVQVQQPFDPTSYYGQYYRANADDGRISPFPSPALPKYNGNVAVLPEVLNPLVLTTAGQPLLVAQTASVSQPLPVFRPPPGLHVPHYPPNFLPYGHYFSPFYVPPGIHQFLSNGSYPQPPQAGLYPAPPPAPSPASVPAVKYPLPEYKPGITNSGITSQVSMPAAYAPCGSTGGTASGNDDTAPSQFKGNCMYFSGQQSEGPGMWIAAATPTATATVAGRDISSLPANSFYNVPPHFAGGYGNMYPPPQAVAAAAFLPQSQPVGGGTDVMGPTSNVYQPQMNWPTN